MTALTLKFITSFLSTVLVLTGLCSCRTVAEKNEICISAAVSLKPVLTEISAEFAKANPSSKVIFNFGASGALMQQILAGAPVDLFVSASEDYISKLQEKKLLNERHDLARNSLVVVSKRNQQLASLKDLSAAGYLVIGNPSTVPLGVYALEFLQNERILETLQGEKKLVLAEDARQVLAYVESGNADFGIVYKSDAVQSEKVFVVYSVPASKTRPIVYQIASLASSRNLALSKRFIEFVLSERGKSIFQRRGFSAND